MKLDRNQNKDKSGKYALLKLRRLKELKDHGVPCEVEKIEKAIHLLYLHGLIHWGNESPDGSEQFFVMKYKDKFTAPALLAYSHAAKDEAGRLMMEDEEKSKSLYQFALQILREHEAAERVGKNIPT